MVKPTSKKRKIDKMDKPSAKRRKQDSIKISPDPTTIESISPIKESKMSKIYSKGDMCASLCSQRASIAHSVQEFKFNKARVHIASGDNAFQQSMKGVLYWMSRDQRVQDNWAFLYSQRLALKFKVPLYVCFCLVPKFLDATIRHYDFLITGLKEVEQECRDLHIPFSLLLGTAKEKIPGFVQQFEIGSIVTDFTPLRVPVQWLEDLKSVIPSSVPIVQIDAHNVVPVWEASDKLEYAARTIRTKIQNKLPDYLTGFPPVVLHPHCPSVDIKGVDWHSAENSLQVNRKVGRVDWAIPGTRAGLDQLALFCLERLADFSLHRNNPNIRANSDLSPWIHFGQISAQRCILTVKERRTNSNKESVDCFIEEALVRRELSDNFCHYNKDYDNLKGAWSWAQTTLAQHSKDKRSPVYTLVQLENSDTYDDLWNASQRQLVVEGKMHGFLRMYWAKKILEWSPSPEQALSWAVLLNDKYSLDGRDPNGYVGCMWSICGVHDQGWAERPIFGKIRFMNYKGCQRKFDVKAFVNSYPTASKTTSQVAKD